MPYKIKTAQLDASTGFVNNDKCARGTRVFYESVFGVKVLTSASYLTNISNAATTEAAHDLNTDFVLSGTGTEISGATMGSDGGTRILASSGASAIGAFVKPRANGRFGKVDWSTSKAPVFECLIQTSSAAVTLNAIQAGLMLTGAMDRTTDADQVKFFYNDSYTTWQLALSNGTSDYVVDTGVTVAASTLYHMVLEVQDDRSVKAYINGDYVGVSNSSSAAAILDATTELRPIVGVASDGNTAGAFIYLYRISCSQDIVA
jgi:hypothetical protein